jgi:hypothetical protein
VRPNGLRISRRLECTTLIDRKTSFLLLDAKMAPIQPVGYSAVLCGSLGWQLRETSSCSRPSVRVHNAGPMIA